MIDLAKHLGHKIEIEKYGRTLELVCITCRNETLLSQDAPAINIDHSIPAPEVCSMEDGCINCGS